MTDRCRRLRPLLLAIAMLGTAGSAAVAAPRDKIPAKRLAAEHAQAQINALNNRLEPAIEAYNHAADELAAVQSQITENRREIVVTTYNVRSVQRQLADELVHEYREGRPDPLAAILVSGSIDDLLASVDVLHRSQSRVGNLVAALVSSRKELRVRRARLARDERRAQVLTAQKAQEKQQIEDGLAQEKRLLHGLEGQIAQLHREQRAYDEHQRALALARIADARRAAAAAAAANPDPGIGGSANTSSSSDPSASSIAPPPPADGSIGSRVVAAAMQWLGVPYVWGGASTSGMDCSGLTLLAYATVGISLPHFTGAQWNVGSHVSRDQLAPGDLVFFYGDHHHVGIYIGGGQFIHAPHTGDVVKISSLDAWYSSAFAGAVRPY